MRNFETVGAAAELFRMSRVSRPNSAWNKSYDAKREVGATDLAKVPMKRGPPSRDANFADFGSGFSQDLGKVVYSRFSQDLGKVVYSRIWVKILT